MSLDRAKKIKLVLFDVDGVLTDGSIWLFPAPASGPQTTEAHRSRHADAPGFGIHSQNMIEAKGFNAHGAPPFPVPPLVGQNTGVVTRRFPKMVALGAGNRNINHL